MKVLVVSDERYAALDALWQQSQGVRLNAATQRPKLPGAKELHALARAGEAPEAFEDLRAQLEAIGSAGDQIRERMHLLIDQADALGVKPGKLAEWSGYSPRRIHQLTRGASE